MLFLLLGFPTIFALNLTFQNDNHCLESLIAKELSFEHTIVIVLTTSTNIFIPKVPVTVLQASNFDTHQSNSFIIYLDDTSTLVFLLPKLDRRAKHVFVTHSSSLVPKILSEGHKAGVHKLVVLQGGQVFRSNPGVCGSLKITSRGCQQTSFFAPRRRFKKCRLRVGTITSSPLVVKLHGRNPGVMVSLVETISEVAGFELVYHNSSEFDHELLNNGTVHKISRALERGEIDVAIGRLMMNDSVTTPFDYGPLLFNDSLMFCTPKPVKLKSYKKLFVVFEMEIWTRVFIGIWIMIVLFYVFGLIENFEKTTILGTMFDVFHICIGGGVSFEPRWVSFRILLTFSFLFALSLDAIYLGNLSQIFGFSSYDEPVDHVDKVRTSQIKFQVNWRIERLALLVYVLRHNPNRHRRFFLRNESMFHLLNETVMRTDYGTIVLNSLYEAYPSEASSLDTFTVVTAYLTLFVTMYIRKGSPFNEALTFWSHEIVERGLPRKWFEDLKLSNIRVSILPKEEEKLVVLKLAHFEESFQVLFGGHALAVVALLLEFVFLKLERIGLVEKIKEKVVFLLMLLKPPELHRNKKKETTEGFL